jgi:hypothetical protein
LFALAVEMQLVALGMKQKHEMIQAEKTAEHDAVRKEFLRQCELRDSKGKDDA